MPSRRCTECGDSLAGKSPSAKTCSSTCRAARSRRIKRVRKENNERAHLSPEQAEVAERVNNSAPDVAHKILEDELRPVVRESITEDTMRAIADMVALTPNAVAALTEDIASEDQLIRQRAYTLLLKYTVGHSALVQPPDQDRTQALQVNFNLPRPGMEEATGAPDVPLEYRECDTCAESKPVDEFAANSTRCLVCYKKQQDRVGDLLASN